MVLSYVGHFYKHLNKKIEKNLERFFLKDKKNYFLTYLIQLVHSKTFYQKSGSVTIELLWIPNFIANFRKIVGAVFEISCDKRMDEQMDGQDWFYRSLDFQQGTNKTNMIIVNTIRRDYWLLGFVYIHFGLTKKLCTLASKFKKNQKIHQIVKCRPICGQNWFHIVGNTFSDFSANIFQNLPNLEQFIFYLISAFFCNFEAKFQPNQRNYC